MINNQYSDVRTRFLRNDERLIVSCEQEMPLVIEPQTHKDAAFLQDFLKTNSHRIVEDIAQYGAVLLRGFDITSDEQFEKTVLSIPEFKGISDAFMAENGRVHVDNLQFVLHTNAVYKTGGTLYLGGFHTENYYSSDVPGYICFFCREPSLLGGETGLINSAKLYQDLSPALQEKLEKNPYFVGKWLVSEVANRYQIPAETVIKLCKQYKLPLIGEGYDTLIAMYKPSVFEHPLTQEKALQINLFELASLNSALRKCFMNDYQGRPWFWHRFFWKLPMRLFNAIENLAVMTIAFFHSPKQSFRILRTKYSSYKAFKKYQSTLPNTQRVGACFTESDVAKLAQSMRNNYCSCLWQKGDILLVDNKKVMHAGMPGVGSRIIRAMICNPLDVTYDYPSQGCINAQDSSSDALGVCLQKPCA